jgi:PadR family transcriptional regulator, regulatory protein AphA
LDTKTLCLGALSQGPCSGYEIRKLFEEGPFGHFQDISFGSIYPALRQLAEDGLVTVTDQEQDGRPDKKVYRLTLDGQEALARAVSADPSEDKVRSDLMFSLYFAHLLSDEQIAKVLDTRIETHRLTVAELERCSQLADAEGAAHCYGESATPGNLPGQKFVRSLGIAIHRTCLDFYIENRDWLIENNCRIRDTTVTADPSDESADAASLAAVTSTSSGRPS